MLYDCIIVLNAWKPRLMQGYLSPIWCHYQITMPDVQTIHKLRPQSPLEVPPAPSHSHTTLTPQLCVMHWLHRVHICLSILILTKNPYDSNVMLQASNEKKTDNDVMKFHWQEYFNWIEPTGWSNEWTVNGRKTPHVKSRSRYCQKGWWTDWVGWNKCPHQINGCIINGFIDKRVGDEISTPFMQSEKSPLPFCEPNGKY